MPALRGSWIATKLSVPLISYESATQFSREYSRFFGLPPSKDALQLVWAGRSATA
jgi:hypothetical protein